MAYKLQSFAIVRNISLMKKICILNVQNMWTLRFGVKANKGESLQAATFVLLYLWWCEKNVNCSISPKLSEEMCRSSLSLTAKGKCTQISEDIETEFTVYLSTLRICSLLSKLLMFKNLSVVSLSHFLYSVDCKVN